MRIIALVVTMVSVVYSAFAQTSDQFETSKGPLTITPILHGTLVLEWQDQVIYVDPYGGASRFEGIKAPTAILITDIHGDHHSAKTLSELAAMNATYIIPEAVSAILDSAFVNRLVIANGESSTFGGIAIKAIPMYNLPESPESRHTKGRGNGYILTFGNKTVYISGDTEGITEMRSLKNIDIAFVCMNLPYTMDVDQAASAVLDFKPKTVYPYHYRGQGGLSDVAQFKELVQAENSKIDVRLRNWYSE